MKISILTLFPQMIEGFVSESIIKRAIEGGIVSLDIINVRDYATDAYGTVDDRPYGGGAGMVLRPDIMYRALCDTLSRHNDSSFSEAASYNEYIEKKEKLQKSTALKLILTSPRGLPFSQKKAQELSTLEHLVVLAGHYEAIDERIHRMVDEEVSLGDYVLTGGEIAAAAIVDATIRLLPGVLKKEEAVAEESFMWVPITALIDEVGTDETLAALKAKGISKIQILEYPHYTRPENFLGMTPPEVIMSGNHKSIQKWRLRTAYEETKKRRPDLLSHI